MPGVGLSKRLQDGEAVVSPYLLGEPLRELAPLARFSPVVTLSPC